LLESMDLIRSATIFTELVAGVKPGEEVLVLVDTKTTKLGELLTTCARASGAEVVLAVYRGESFHGEEPNKIIASAMKGADVCLSTIHGLGHAVAVQQAEAAGMRALSFFRDTGGYERLGRFDLTFDDMDEIRKRNRKLVDMLKIGKNVRITTPGGSDLTFNVEGRTPLDLGPFEGRRWVDVDRSLYPKLPNWLGYAETAIAPVTGTAEGTYVVDGHMEGVGLVDEPIVWTVKRGRAVEIRGGKSAQILTGIIRAADENANNLGEFGIGTNHKVKMQVEDNLDKCQYGTVHMALGHNKGALKGEVFSNVHMDGISLNATIIIDNKVIMKDGELKI